MGKLHDEIENFGRRTTKALWAPGNDLVRSALADLERLAGRA